eukprot:CAMPEP_0181467384 /NCGR_PEP_ID=MMETSP1110-20121109/36952_1 /TAXON_ID=174948 /ORGANISM="Symbiodinium sp., Strain CCMP421" /LENGTH=171 /DNA_ID=CAMNT_0023592211 /DNA_START=47 /DNA_END=563 /DNA_ORIENTATION=-
MAFAKTALLAAQVVLVNSLWVRSQSQQSQTFRAQDLPECSGVVRAGEAKCDELGADNCKGYTLIAPGMFASCGVVGPNCLTTGPMCKEVVRWFLGSNGQTCNGICKAKGFTACNKEKMASLDTAEKMDTAEKQPGTLANWFQVIVPTQARRFLQGEQMTAIIGVRVLQQAV